MFRWLFGVRATTDDTEELIHLKNMNENTELTNINTLQRINRARIEREGQNLSDDRIQRIMGEKHDLLVRVQELEHRLRSQQSVSRADTIDVVKMEALLRNSVFKGLVANRVGQNYEQGFLQSCQKIEVSLANDASFTEAVEETVATRLASLAGPTSAALLDQESAVINPIKHIEGQGYHRRQSILKNVLQENSQLRIQIEELEGQLGSQQPRPKSDMLNVVKMEGLIRAAIFKELVAHRVGQQSDEHFHVRCQQTEMYLSCDEGFLEAVDAAVAQRLGSVGMPSRQISMKP